MCVVSPKFIRILALTTALGLRLAGSASASPIVSFSGPDNPFQFGGGFAIGGGRAVQWLSTLEFEDVSVTADLSTFIGVPSEATAFLTTDIGPGTTAADEIAHVTVALPDFSAASHTVTLFTGLHLAPAHYYLILTTPSTNGIWKSSEPNDAIRDGFPCPDPPNCPVVVPGFPSQQFFAGSADPYAPARVFTPFNNGFGLMHHSVDGTLVQEAPPDDPGPGAEVPEPASITLLVTGGILGGIRRLRTRARAASR